jgi:hypothetical protein
MSGCNPNRVGDGDMVIDRLTRLARSCGYMRPDMYFGTAARGLQVLETHFGVKDNPGQVGQRLKRLEKIWELQSGAFA